MSAAPHRLAAAQVEAWAGFRADAPEALAEMARLNDADPAFFVVALSGRTARLLDKPAHFPAAEIAGTAKPSHNLLTRAHAYRRLFEAALRRDGIAGELRLALCVHDLVAEQAIPVFAFQKRRGSRLVLLPDIDFMRHRFYAAPAFADHVPFAGKRDRAIFVGSTSGGGVLTADAVRRLAAPRLRAAVHFRGSPRVDFWLPRIVQCADATAAEAIRALDVAGPPLEWPAPFAWRYLISMDGNGATCSRVVLALRSNGLLLKYESPHLLFYSDELRPWVHYIPIAEDADILRAMDRCAAEPALAEAIAVAGQHFYSTHLEQAAVLAYTRHLLEAYRARCFGG
jgi:hypothetical protein